MNFSALSAYLDGMEARFGIPGCAMIILRAHETVYTHSAGAHGGAGHGAFTPDTRVWLYSLTKLSTCTAALQLVESGRLRLTDRVGDYLPAFAHLTVQRGEEVVPANTPLTVEHLFTMTGGLDYDIDAPAIRRAAKTADGASDTRHIVSAIAEKPLVFEPGSHFLYSLGHDVLGALIEVVSGQKFSAYLTENVFTPLGMTETRFFPDESELAALAPQYSAYDEIGRADPIPAINDNRLSAAYESGGAGLSGTCRDYALLIDALANDGTGRNGARILRPETVVDMRTNRLYGAALSDFQLPFKPDYGYGLGVRTLLSSAHSLSPVGEFGWDGAAGAYACIDPFAHIAVLYTQHVRHCGYLFSDEHQRLRDLVYEGLRG